MATPETRAKYQIQINRAMLRKPFGYRLIYRCTALSLIREAPLIALSMHIAQFVLDYV
jgi:hypothetical protein